MRIDSEITVGELISRHPSVIRVFIQRKMLCVGCPVEAFHTLEDAARFHGILLVPLIQDLENAAGRPS
jgi:hybrid cluster-associated redox disulfide protein